jgi:GNAT superfamily N-acetyltransferase/vacuolar-type H+-ATPase subunit E/Vma4
MKNIFKGGMSADLSAFDVAKKWKISPIEFMPILEKGTEHELEHTDDKDVARRIALDHIVERLDYYEQLDKIEMMKKGAILEKPEIFNDITLYYEKKGNWLFAKGNFYAWLYDEKGAGAKLQNQEYDFIMFPPMGKGNPFSEKYVPPLRMIWDKSYQKKFKGINHLLGIVKGFYDEDKNQIIIDMMTTNPKFRRQGINAHIIKNLREEFGVSQDDVIFDKPTKEGKLFESSKKYENGGLIAPNGEQSNLTPELYELVRTKAFKNWFGDWENDPENASKVIDKNGEPKIVYHGTNNDFTIFDKNKLGEKNFFAESASLGFFFAGNIKTSEAYIGMNSMDWAGVQFGAYDDIINKYKPELDSINKDIQQIYEKYRKQEKDNIKKLQDEIIEKIRQTHKDLSENDLKGIFIRDMNWDEINKFAQEENNLNGNTQKLKELNDKIKSEIEAKWKVKTNANPRIISLFLNIRNPYIIDYANNKQTDLSQDIKTAIKNTNDGVIFNNLKDGDDVDDIFVVFDSEQIKLADGTNTTFDINNPDIRFAKGGDTNRNFNDKELLKRYNQGESIGFTAIAHLKAQGLIERSDGTKRKSINSFKQGGLIAPNGELSNLTPEQYNLVRTPEFKGWFGFWDLYPSGKANDYYQPNVRTIARELKQEKFSAIQEVVDFLSKQVNEEDVLIPMPSRYGYATDTQKLVEKISERTGAKVFDCLVGKKRQSIYELKKTNQDVSDFEFDFQINCEIPKARNYFIVDNVIGTGITMKNALMNVIARVGKNVSPLVYAIDLNNISKVVDENDEPLVVHHGSIIDTKFDIFDYKKADLGFHFGTKEQAKKRVESKSVLPPRKSIVNSFFLNIRVLFEMTDVGEWQYPQRYIDELMSDNIIEEKVAKQKGFLSLYRREDNTIIRDYIKSKYGSFVGFVYNNKYEGKGKSFIALSRNEIKLADGSNKTFDSDNPDIRFDKGGEIQNLIEQGEMELKVYPTTPEHANLYGFKSKNPLYIQSIFISENQRLKGIGKKVLKYLNDFAIKNGHDVMFGHITQKASFSKDDSRQSNLDDVAMIKNWLQSNGYEICEGNNDFYKVVNNPDIRFAKGGKTISQTPAPASDRVSGSKTNPKGSASDSSLARSIKFNDSLLKAIENKVKAHNEEYPSKKVTIPTAKAVVRRGMGAYSKSHRPFITGGAPNSRQAWGLARLNKFLLKKRGVKVKSAYVQDDDLL